MSTFSRFFAGPLLCASFVFSAHAAPPQTIQGKTATQIIQDVNRRLEGRSSQGDMEMKIVTPRWQRTLRMKIWSKGLDYSFVRILSPQRERGMASLKRKEQMWNFLPRAAMVMRIPPSMMGSSWMGSDFTNDDLIKGSNLVRDYSAKIQRVKGKGEQERAEVELIPRPNAPVVWGKLTIWVRTKDMMPLEQNYFDDKGRLIRKMTFSDFKQMGDRIFPTVMKMQNLQKPGHHTTMIYHKIQFNKDISSSTFSLRNLKKKSW